MARLIAIALCVAILLTLFIFPRQRLNEVCDAIDRLANETVGDILNEDWNAGAKKFDEMYTLYENDKPFLHLFLSHECVETLETSILGGIQLIKVEDQPQTLLELATIITHVQYLKSIEELRLLTLI